MLIVWLASLVALGQLAIEWRAMLCCQSQATDLVASTPACGHRRGVLMSGKGIEK